MRLFEQNVICDRDPLTRTRYGIIKPKGEGMAASVVKLSELVGIGAFIIDRVHAVDSHELEGLYVSLVYNPARMENPPTARVFDEWKDIEPVRKKTQGQESYSGTGTDCL